jgi:endonuclease-3
VTKAERATFVLKELTQRYPHPAVPLDHRDPFTLLIAVLLSAQCTDKKVNEVTPELFARASTPAQMVKLTREEIYAIIRPCGLGPQKSKAILELSKILLREHGGKVPRTLEELEELPGVGHKTAQVVVAQAFLTPAFPVDTHIHRLAKRWGFTDGRSVIQTERDLKKLFPVETWNALHLQMIFYGREFCGARSCDGSKCEICQSLYPRRGVSARKTVSRAKSVSKKS